MLLQRGVSPGRIKAGFNPKSGVGAPPHTPYPTSPCRYLLGQQGQRVLRLRGRRGGRLQKVVFGVRAGHGTVRATAVWLPPRDYHHPSGSRTVRARLRVGRRNGCTLRPSSAWHDAGGAAGAASAARARTPQSPPRPGLADLSLARPGRLRLLDGPR